MHESVKLAYKDAAKATGVKNETLYNNHVLCITDQFIKMYSLNNVSTNIFWVYNDWKTHFATPWGIEVPDYPFPEPHLCTAEERVCIHSCC